MYKDIASILSLPWATLLVLASGYAGYYIANAGLREHQKPVDVVFSSLVFGFAASFPYYTLLYLGAGVPVSSLVAFVFSLLLGGLWSRIGRKKLETVLRSTGVSLNNDLPNAWHMLLSETGVYATQLTVTLTDGTCLHCADLRKFKSMPNGPCVFGKSGDVLMYVTHTSTAPNPSFDQQDLEATVDWPMPITYIPKEKIERLSYSRKQF